MIWASPWAFILLIPLLAILAWNYLNRFKKRPSLKFSFGQALKQVNPGLRSYLVGFGPLLKLAGLVLAVIALARPQEASTKQRRNVEGIDIMLVLDTSDSMLIEDMQPENRLESAKDTIREFIQGRVSDRIGLLVFSGESYTRVPLTLDYPLLLGSLAEVQTSRNLKMGTAIGVALANGVARLKDSDNKSKVIVFLTDGESNSGTVDPETALDIAKGYGIKIYTIGIGKDGQAQLPVFLEAPNGQKIKRYRPMHSKVNEELLRKMADDTGGSFYRAATTKGLKDIFRSIDRLERSDVEVSQYTRYAELFPPFLRWGVLLYLLSLFVSQVMLRRGP